MIIKNFNKYLLETRKIDDRENLTTYNQLINFLKKHHYNFNDTNKEIGTGGGGIFVSLKVGNFTALIPPKDTSNIYVSPQGFYCFDFKVAKEFLFDGEIKPENFYINPHNQIGLGVNNKHEVKDPNKIENGMPRFLYVLKAKKEAVILNNSQNDNVADYFFVRFVNWYSNHFQKYQKATIFDPKKKIDLKLTNMQSVKEYFEKNKSNYDDQYVTYVSMYCNKKSFSGLGVFGEEERFVSLYRFIYECSKIIKNEHYFIRMNVIFNAIGVDGFTQTKSDGQFIHSPDYQTLLFNEHCIEDKIVIDRKLGDKQSLLNDQEEYRQEQLQKKKQTT